MKKVLTTGCFDILHLGHIRLLQHARQCGDYLVVGINSDRAARELRGPGHPVNSAEHRWEVLASLRMVDEVVEFDQLDARQIIAEIRPSVWIVGGHSLAALNAGDIAAVRAVGGRAEVFSIQPGFSTEDTVRLRARSNDAHKRDF